MLTQRGMNDKVKNSLPPTTTRMFRSDSQPLPKNFTLFRWPDGFATAQHLDLEVGCGAGWHPIQYVTANPHRHLIAIEHTRGKFARFANRLAGHEGEIWLKRLLPIHDDAVRWVTHILAPASLDRVIFLYPNPEPKAPNRRWFRMPFMSQMLSVTKPRAEFCLATNDASYFFEALQWAQSRWNLEIVEERIISASSAPRSHFEKKYLLRGETCYDVVFRKRT